MAMGFEETQATYISGSQSARVWSETWVGSWAFCVSCGHAGLTKFANNSPLADFYCEGCREQFELKAKSGTLQPRVADGAYRTKIERLSSAQNPNLLLMTYNRDERAVTNLIAVPKHYFVPRIIEQRPPLRPTARRAGWEGSNILLKEIPELGQNFHCEEWSSARARLHSAPVARDKLPSKRNDRCARLVARGHASRRTHRQARIRDCRCLRGRSTVAGSLSGQQTRPREDTPATSGSARCWIPRFRISRNLSPKAE